MSSLRHTPSPEYRFWLYSPEGDGLTFWQTAEERDAYAVREINSYLDDSVWFEEVENIIAGVVTHTTQAINIQHPVGALDGDGYDEEGDYWEDPDDTKCDYALVSLPNLEGK